MSMEIKTEEEEVVISSIEKAKNDLKAIESDYEVQYPSAQPSEDNMPQYKAVERPTYDQIKEEAVNALGAYETTSKKEIQNDFAAQIQQIANKEQEVLVDTEQKSEAIQSEKIDDVERHKANMIYQGLERSSIAGIKEETIKSDYDAQLVELIEKSQLALTELELKKSMAQNEMNIALEKFDIAYAAKLEKKIEELSKNYDKEIVELEKYNTEIAELRNKRNQEWQKWVTAKTSEINAQKSRAKVEYLIDLVKTLSKEEAIELIEDAEIIASLGDHYQIVLDYVNRRK